MELLDKDDNWDCEFEAELRCQAPSRSTHQKANPTISRATSDDLLLAQEESQEEASAPGDQHQLCFMAFDLLLVNDKCVMDLPLSQRRELLEKSVMQRPRQFEIVAQTKVTNLNDINNAIDRVLLNQEEGIILKNLHSLYVAGERKNSWLKIKPDYIEGLVNDLDVLIVGGYYGSGIGRRAGTISHFLLGVRVPPSSSLLSDQSPFSSSSSASSSFTSPPEGPEFHSFCKVGSGYSLRELAVLQKTLEPHWRVYDIHKPPKWLHLVHPFKEKPDVWIAPNHSCVVQIKGAQVIPTDKFRTGHTLRFPRVQHLRYDKPWTDALDLRELSQIITSSLLSPSSSSATLTKSGQGLKRSASGAGLEGGEGEPETKRSRTTKASQLQIAPQFQAANLQVVNVKNSLFQGVDFCVMNGYQPTTAPSSSSSSSAVSTLTVTNTLGTQEEATKDQGISTGLMNDVDRLTKQQIEVLLFENGASVLQHPPDPTKLTGGKKRECFVVALKETLKVKNLIKKGCFDIVHPKWILDSVRSQERQPLSPKYVLYTSPATRRLFSVNYDRFGDSFTSPCTFDSLSEVFSSLPLVHPFLLILTVWSIVWCCSWGLITVLWTYFKVGKIQPRGR